jgi:hypothetical protein
MKKYVVRSSYDADKLSIISAGGFVPKNTLCVLPPELYEEESVWLKTVELVSEDNPEYSTLVVEVDEALKTQILTNRQAAIDASAWLNNRKANYPVWEEVMEALIENAEGRPEKLAEVSALRATVRDTYPKPE